MVSGRSDMTSPIGMYMCNTADIIPKLEHIRNADINELSEIQLGGLSIDLKGWSQL